MKWFKHDTAANMDAKLQEVMLDYGLEGYGLYWYCIELIAQRVNVDNLTFELEHDCRIIARNTGSTAQKVEQMMKDFIELGLFCSENGHVFCLKLADRCDDFTRKIVNKQQKTVKNQSVGLSPSKSDKVRLDKIRLDKNIKTLDQLKIDREKLEVDSFNHWWKSYPKKVAKQSALKAWQKTIKKMGDEKVIDLTNHIVEEVKIRLDDLATGSDKFIGFDRLHATTYLNQERYNDE